MKISSRAHFGAGEELESVNSSLITTTARINAAHCGNANNHTVNTGDDPVCELYMRK